MVHRVRPGAVLLEARGLPEGYDLARIEERFRAGDGDGPFPSSLRRAEEVMGGTVQANPGYVPGPDLGSDDETRLACFAPFAGFMLVAAADGELDPAEEAAFHQALQEIRDPLLCALVDRGAADFAEQMRAMQDNPDLVRDSLGAARRLFAREEGGDRAREELMRVLRQVAAGDDEVSADEELILDRIERRLAPPSLALSALGCLTVLAGLAGVVGALVWIF